MRTSLKQMPEKVSKYVFNTTLLVNISLLLCHIYFGVLFYLFQADTLFYYNCISILCYLAGFYLLKKNKDWTYVIMVYVEIFIFMILTVTHLGWDYGFQHYCIGFVVSLLFTDFYMYHEKYLRKRTLLLIFFNVLFYLVLKFWTSNHPYVYKINNRTIIDIFYVINTLIGFSFLIIYSLIYASTVSKLENELLEMANKDSLTELWNRRKMMQMLKTMMEDDQKQLRAIAMLDIDHFKRINDTYGHIAGDEVLKAFASVLKEKIALEPNFDVSRWGGEEFLAVYKSYDGDDTAIIQEFERLRQQIENKQIKYNGNIIHITATIGVAFFHEENTIDKLIQHADRHLYEGKDNGRNKVVY